MKINEVKMPSVQRIDESVERGEITESVGKILKAHNDSTAFGPAMTLEESLAEDQRILAEAGIQ